jgi:hypothetical protein
MDILDTADDKLELHAHCSDLPLVYGYAERIPKKHVSGKPVKPCGYYNGKPIHVRQLPLSAHAAFILKGRHAYLRFTDLYKRPDTPRFQLAINAVKELQEGDILSRTETAADIAQGFSILAYEYFVAFGDIGRGLYCDWYGHRTNAGAAAHFQQTAYLSKRSRHAMTKVKSYNMTACAQDRDTYQPGDKYKIEITFQSRYFTMRGIDISSMGTFADIQQMLSADTCKAFAKYINLLDKSTRRKLKARTGLSKISDVPRIMAGLQPSAKFNLNKSTNKIQTKQQNSGKTQSKSKAKQQQKGAEPNAIHFTIGIEGDIQAHAGRPAQQSPPDTAGRYTANAMRFYSGTGNEIFVEPTAGVVA